MKESISEVYSEGQIRTKGNDPEDGHKHNRKLGHMNNTVF